MLKKKMILALGSFKYGSPYETGTHNPSVTVHTIDTEKVLVPDK